MLGSPRSWHQQIWCLLNSELASLHRGQARPKRGPDHSRLVGGSFNEQGNLHTRLLLGILQKQVDLYTCPSESYGLYRSLNWTQSLNTSKGSQQHSTLSRLCLWDSSHRGNSGQNIYSKGRGGCESFWLPGSRFLGGHIFSSASSSVSVSDADFLVSSLGGRS